MSGYSEISDPIDHDQTEETHPSATATATTAITADSYSYDGNTSSDAAPAKKNRNAPAPTNAVDFDDELNVGFIVKILTFVGVGIAGCGLFIALASLASASNSCDWFQLLGAIAPLFLMVLIVFERISHRLWFGVVVTVLSMTTAIFSFFELIALAKVNTNTKPPYNGGAAGNFFTFLGETIVCVASFLAQFGF